MTDHPTIAEQIDAVEWAEARTEELAQAQRARHLPWAMINELRRRLEAAAETLRTLEFGSEIAR